MNLRISMYSQLILILAAVIAFFMGKMWMRESVRETMIPIFPREGTVIVSTARGSGRNISLMLADAGFHVIVGVESSAEAKSFKYTTSKGIEPVILDLAQPGDIAQMMYRLDAVNERHHRSLVGLILIRDFPQVGDQKQDHLSVLQVDATYDRYFQGYVRLLEGAMTFFNYSSGRLVLVRSQLQSEYMSRAYTGSCSISCTMWDMVATLARSEFGNDRVFTIERSLRWPYPRRRPLPVPSDDSSQRGNKQASKRRRDINTTYTQGMVDWHGEEDVTLAVLHALRSRSPQQVYWLGQFPLPGVVSRIANVATKPFFRRNDTTFTEIGGDELITIGLRWFPFLSTLFSVCSIFKVF